MINVVFLLLIFFLMTAQIVPPEPFEVTPPTVDLDGPPTEGEITVFLNGAGTLAFGDIIGEDAVFDALAGAKQRYCGEKGCSKSDPPLSLILRADASAPGARLAALLTRIAPLEFAEVQLVTVSE